MVTKISRRQGSQVETATIVDNVSGRDGRKKMIYRRRQCSQVETAIAIVSPVETITKERLPFIDKPINSYPRTELTRSPSTSQQKFTESGTTPLHRRVNKSYQERNDPLSINESTKYYLRVRRSDLPRRVSMLHYTRAIEVAFI